MIIASTNEVGHLVELIIERENNRELVVELQRLNRAIYSAVSVFNYDYADQLRTKQVKAIQAVWAAGDEAIGGIE